VIPASYIGIELGRNQLINQYAKPLFIISLIISFGIFITIPTLISTDLHDLVDVFAGGHYQALSYFAGLAFLITSIYYSFYIDKPSFFITLFFLCLILGQIVTIILSGGRGGLVVVFGGLLSIVYLKSRKGSFIPYTFGIGVFLYLFLLIFLSFDFGQGDRVVKGAMRLVSYIDSGGINFSQGSNRDIFYGQAIEYIKASPVYGYGPFTIYDHSPKPYFGLPGFYYPHNLFLEILIHGGILYLFIWLIILSIFFMKLSKIISIDKTQVIILAPFLYSFIQLMFSGTYLQEPLFWFSICYVLATPMNSFQKEKL
jgi:oligosaccharide repeat unit polymerase